MKSKPNYTICQMSNGKIYDFDNPTEDMVDLDSIVSSLAKICRYGGHIPEFYSVLDHSILVHDLVSPENRLDALMHDAGEAYVGDMVKPLKIKIPLYNDYEDRCWKVIARKFGLSYDLPDEVHRADLHACYLEANKFYGTTIDNWHLTFKQDDMVEGMVRSYRDPVRAFMTRYNRLVTNDRSRSNG